MQKYIYTTIKFFLVLVVLSIGFQACSNDDPVTPENNDRAKIAQTTSLGVIAVEDINKNFTDSNTIIPFTLKYSVEVFSISYYTIDANGDEALVSGALLVPQGLNNLPLLSLQHGTESKRDQVASVSPLNSVEGTIGLITSSLGYLTIIPDYLGFGVSNVMHPYLHAESLVPSVIDFMHAAKTYSLENQIVLDGRVFLTGYSEGGYLSLLVQKFLEENPITELNLTAVAPMSGPYNLKGMMETIFSSKSYITPAYIAYFITAYNAIYGWNRLNDFFNAPYANLMPGLFNGNKTWGEILSQLPSSFSELINPNFTSELLNGNESAFVNALEENTILNWTPKTPLHFFHGDSDKIVPYQNVLTAIEQFTSRGATNIQLTTIAGGTHLTSGPEESMGAIMWFESF